MISYKKNPTGGMGNRLFQLNFLGQVAYAMKTDFRFCSTLDEPYFFNIEKKSPSRISRIFEQALELKSYVITDTQNFRDYLASLSPTKDYQIKGSFLGESFFETCFVDPIDIVKPKFQLGEQQRYVAMHFRGGDFAAWNSEAILPAKYYLDALEQISVNGETNLPVKLVTDDTSLPAFQQIRKLLGSRAQINPASEYIDDFITLANSEYLVSSPSTFAIWAGILGKPKIVHSETWAASRVLVNDKFWVNLKNGGNKYYNVSQFI